MSHEVYQISKTIAAHDYPFYALLMALIRKADTNNLAKIKSQWPNVAKELQERYNAPGGFLPSDERTINSI